MRRFAALRSRPDHVLVDGFHAVKHALRFGAEIEIVLAVDPAGARELARALAPDVHDRLREALRAVPESQLRELLGRVPHTGMVAVARKPDVDVRQVLDSRVDRPVVLLQDPRHLGNVGAAIRVAAAADACAVLTTGIHDPWDPTAIRGSAGLHFAVPVARVESLAQSHRPLVALDPRGEALVPHEISRQSVLAFGSERHGLGAELLGAAERRVAIPMRAGVSSLNLATSVSAVLFALDLAKRDAGGASIGTRE